MATERERVGTAGSRTADPVAARAVRSAPPATTLEALLEASREASRRIAATNESVLRETRERIAESEARLGMDLRPRSSGDG